MKLFRSTLLLASFIAILSMPARAADRQLKGVVDCDGVPVPGAVVLVSVSQRPDPIPAAEPTVQGKPNIRVRPPVSGPAAYENPWLQRQLTARTDAQGHFILELADNDSTVSGIVAAPGFACGFLRWHENEVLPDIQVKLKRLEPLDSKLTAIRGRVVGIDGHAIVGAVVARIGSVMSTRGASHTSDPNGDVVSITDAKGEFVQPLTTFDERLPERQRVTAAILRVSSAGFARTETDELSPDDHEHTIVLAPGATVTGRVEVPPESSGRLRVALDPGNADRHKNPELPIQALVDDHGGFIIYNVPVGIDLRLYAVVYDQRVSKASSVVPIKKLGQGQTFDAGTVRLIDGVSVAGKVTLEDTQEPFEPGQSISLFLPQSLLYWRVPIESDGSFKFSNIPPGPKYSLSYFKEGYRMSRSNPNFDGHYFELHGEVTRSHSDIEVRLDRVAPPGNPASNVQSRPLHGVDLPQ